MTEEVRVTSSTGGAKGSKPQRMALLPPEALMKLSEVYAFGASKYDDFNYRKGYPWHLSADALQRHFQLWNSGQDLDDESGLPHILHAAWHCLTLYMFSLEHPDFDDRFPAMWEKHLEELAADKASAVEEVRSNLDEMNKNVKQQLDDAKEKRESAFDTLRPILKGFNYSTNPETNPDIAYCGGDPLTAAVETKIQETYFNTPEAQAFFDVFVSGGPYKGSYPTIVLEDI